MNLGIQEPTDLQIKQIQLEIAIEFKKICKKHNLKYFLVAGTLLGAVRHQGFIPWDDDFDVAMLRSEYEKFLKFAKLELPPAYFLQTWETDENFGLPIAKIRKNNTTYKERNSQNVKMHHGIFIDIFPLDNSPSDIVQMKNHRLKTYFLKRAILIKKGYILWGKTEYSKKIIYMLFNVLLQPFKIKLIEKQLISEMKKYNRMNTEKVVGIGGAYDYYKEVINKEWIEEYSELPFENIYFTCPKMYENYLSNMYGDFMTPPPVNVREDRHKILEIRIDK